MDGRKVEIRRHNAKTETNREVSIYLFIYLFREREREGNWILIWQPATMKTLALGRNTWLQWKRTCQSERQTEWKLRFERNRSRTWLLISFTSPLFLAFFGLFFLVGARYFCLLVCFCSVRRRGRRQEATTTKQSVSAVVFFVSKRPRFSVQGTVDIRD